MPLAALGMFVFDLRTAPYETLSRETSWRISEHNRVGARPSLQYLGPGDDNITLEGQLAREITGHSITLELLRIQAGMGRAWPLIDGRGYFFGLWMIESISEDRRLFFSNGECRALEFSVSLRRYGEGDLEGLGDLARVAALAASMR